MPERPDLEYVVPRLTEMLVGAKVVGGSVRKPVVLRCAIDEVRGEILGVVRRSHAVNFDFGERHLVISPMLAGRFDVVEGGKKAPGDTAVSFDLADGRRLLYRDDVQMGKVWWTAPGAPVPGLVEGGVDVLSPAFTTEKLRAMAKGRREQLKVFLMDKTAFDAMGNAYADEVLWEAGLHPKRQVSRLTAEELDALHAAIVRTLTSARDTIAARAPPLPEKVRDFLHVRGKKGEPCDRCGTTLRVAGILGHDAYFCPSCQPDAEGKGFVDWRKA